MLSMKREEDECECGPAGSWTMGVGPAGSRTMGAVQGSCWLPDYGQPPPPPRHPRPSKQQELVMFRQ